MTFEVRRLAVIDLYGARGTARRRRLVRAEFAAAFALGIGLGLWVLVRGGPAGWVIGLALIGIGLNYLPLAVHALTIRPARLSAEVAAMDDFAGQVRYYATAQARLLVPGLVAVLALRRHQGGTEEAR